MQRKYYPFSNDYMFCRVLASKPELARRLLELLLNIEINSVKVINAQKILNYSLAEKSVRFDVYIKDDKNTVYDVEMQIYDQGDLEKRIRYYHAAIATDNLKRGEQNYNQLNDAYVIFICKYDPFKLGKSKYILQTSCINHPQLYYNDGARTIIINTSSNETNIDEELRQFLDYVYENKSSKNGLIYDIEKQVKNINEDYKWRLWAMTFEEKLYIARKEGLNEGINEGKSIVIKQMLEDGVINKEEAQKYLKQIEDKKDYVEKA